MRLTLNVPDNLVHDILESLPECSMSFRVDSWDYEACRFKLMDWETGKYYTLTKALADKGFRYVVRRVLAGEYPGLDLNNPFDAGCWDSYATDHLLQAAVLGECPYG